MQEIIRNTERQPKDSESTRNNVLDGKQNALKKKFQLMGKKQERIIVVVVLKEIRCWKKKKQVTPKDTFHQLIGNKKGRAITKKNVSKP